MAGIIRWYRIRNKTKYGVHNYAVFIIVGGVGRAFDCTYQQEVYVMMTVEMSMGVRVWVVHGGMLLLTGWRGEGSGKKSFRKLVKIRNQR